MLVKLNRDFCIKGRQKSTPNPLFLLNRLVVDPILFYLLDKYSNKVFPTKLEPAGSPLVGKETPLKPNSYTPTCTS